MRRFSHGSSTTSAKLCRRCSTRIASALGEDDAVLGLCNLSSDLGLRGGLRQLGFTEDGIAETARLVVEVAPATPRPVTTHDVCEILEHAMGENV